MCTRAADFSHRASAALFIVAIAAMALESGCAVLPALQHAGFLAHSGYRGLVVDRMDGAPTALLVGAPSASSAGGPTHILQSDDHTLAALWVADSQHVTVRQAQQATAPLLGDVLAFWKGGALRLIFHLANGESFQTSRFQRIDSQTSPDVLGRERIAVMDLPGVYRAELLDTRRQPVGWLRVRIFPYTGLPRDYGADVPAPLNGALAAGAMALVDAEIDSIIARNSFPGDRQPEGIAP